MGLSQILSAAGKARKLKNVAEALDLNATKEKIILDNIKKFGNEFFTPARSEGATLDPFTGKFVDAGVRKDGKLVKPGKDKGYAMATIKNQADNEIKDLKSLIEFAKKPEIMNRLKDGQKLGGWYDPEKKAFIADPSKIHSTKLGSLWSGVRNKQDAGFNIKTGDIYDTTKTDLAKEGSKYAGAGLIGLGSAGALSSKNDFHITPKEEKAAGIAALLAAGALTKGKVYGIPLKTLLKTPSESLGALTKGVEKSVKPSALENVYAARSISRPTVHHSKFAEGWDTGRELPGTLLDDGYPDVVYTYTDPVTQVSKRILASQLPGYMPPKLVTKNIINAGSVLTEQGIKDISNVLSGKEIKSLTKGTQVKNYNPDQLDVLTGKPMEQYVTNKAPQPTGGKLRINKTDKKSMIEEANNLIDTSTNNLTKVPFSEIIQQRKLEGKIIGNKLDKSFGGAFNNKANKLMETRLTELANNRPEVVNQVVKLANDFKQDPEETLKVYAYLSGNTSHAGAMEKLSKAIASNKGLKLEDFTKTDSSGRVIIPDTETAKIKSAAGMLESPFSKGLEVDFNGSKVNALADNLINIYTSGKKGKDISIIDSNDIMKMLSLDKSNDTIAKYIFDNPTLYKLLQNSLNIKLGKPGLMSNALNKYTKGSISATQSILRNRKGTAG